MIHALCKKNCVHPVRLLLLSALPLLTFGCGGGTNGIEGPDPGIVDYPIAYVKRPTPIDDQVTPPQPAQQNVRDPLFFGAGGDLYIRERATTSSQETNITASITGGTGDVKDVEVSPDGQKLIFALRLEDLNPADDDVPSWNIWEYNRETGLLRRIISNDSIAEKGDDVAPHYLPDGSIVFSSTRQITSRAINFDEDTINNKSNLNKEPYSYHVEDRNTDSIAFVLHTMDEDGNNIKQISFGQSHDLDPTIMNDGRILFSRWTYAGNANRNGGAVSLYSMNPDGGNLQLVYGAHSENTGTNDSPIQFVHPRELPDGNIVAIVKPTTGTFGGGDIFRINLTDFVDHNQSVATRIVGGTGQQPATSNVITTDGTISPEGRYSNVFPLWDGTSRMLVSKSLCQILVENQARFCVSPWIDDPTMVELPPAYNIWMYDPSENTEKLVVLPEEGMIITDVVAMAARTRPDFNTVTFIDPSLEQEGMGLLHIHSVYDLDGNYNDFGSGLDLATLANSTTPADQRPARFLRLIKPIGLPDPDDPKLQNPPDLANTAFGRNRNLGMREILGYAPIEPDGSVMVKVPANVPFALEILDHAGRRIGARHNTWLQVKAGEKVECNGCHEHPTDGRTPQPHGRSDAVSTAYNSGAGGSLPSPWYSNLNTEPAMFATNGDTMAMVRYNRCFNTGACPTAENFNPSIDLIYDDVWTDDGKVLPDSSILTANPRIAYIYGDLDHLDPINDAPATDACQQLNPYNLDQSKWQKECRIIIHYEKHIHPIWNKDRLDTVTNSVDVKCTNCHSTRTDPADVNTLRVPAGQLNLSDDNPTDDPTDEPDHLKAYRELFFNDQGQTVNGNLLDDITITDCVRDPVDPTICFIDPVTGTITQIQIPDPNAAVSPSMTAAGARASYFMEKMTESELNAGRSLTPVSDPDYVDHSAMLTGAELRLIGEWLDIGGQYYNNPFDPNAPQN